LAQDQFWLSREVAITLTKIRKRDRRVVDLDSSRIRDAIQKAFIAIELEDGERAENITREAIKLLNIRFKERVEVEILF